MFEVDIIFAQDLSNDMKESYQVDESDNRFYIVITNNKEIIFVESDYMEPEDATFIRDLQWIKEVLLLAYKLGKEDSNKQVIRSISMGD